MLGHNILQDTFQYGQDSAVSMLETRLCRVAEVRRRLIKEFKEFRGGEMRDWRIRRRWDEGLKNSGSLDVPDVEENISKLNSNIPTKIQSPLWFETTCVQEVDYKRNKIASQASTKSLSNQQTVSMLRISTCRHICKEYNTPHHMENYAARTHTHFIYLWCAAS